MQLAITILGSANHDLINELVRANTGNPCQIVDLKASIFSDTYCAYLLIEGNWNQLSKFESTLHAIQKKFNCLIHSQRTENVKNADMLPLSIEVIGLAGNDLLNQLILFFGEKNIDVLEINTHNYPAPYLDAKLTNARFVISLPNNESLFQLRDELMYLCDSLNADLLFEPFKIGA